MIKKTQYLREPTVWACTPWHVEEIGDIHGDPLLPIPPEYEAAIVDNSGDWVGIVHNKLHAEIIVAAVNEYAAKLSEL